MQNINLSEANYHTAGSLGPPTWQKSFARILQRCKWRNLAENPENLVLGRSKGEGPGPQALPLGAPLNIPA